MAIQATDTSDASMCLEGIARALVLLPEGELDAHWLGRKNELVAGLHALARNIWPSPEGQTFEAGAGYSANEYRDEFLFTILPKAQAVDAAAAGNAT